MYIYCKYMVAPRSQNGVSTQYYAVMLAGDNLFRPKRVAYSSQQLSRVPSSGPKMVLKNLSKNEKMKIR